MKQAAVVTLGVVFVIFAVLASGEHHPKGSDFQVNVQTEGFQWRPAVAIAPNGRFLVAWADGFDLRVRAGGASGSLGDERPGLPLIFAQQTAISSATQIDGTFLVIWEGNDIFFPFPAIQGRRFASDGTPIDEPFLVSLGNGRVDFGPTSVDVDGAGRFVVAWESCGSDTFCDYGAFLVSRRFLPTGVPRGAPDVIAYTSYYFSTYPNNPDVASFSDGSYLVVWEDREGIYGRRGLVDGGFDGPRVLVHESAPGTRSLEPALAVEHTGAESALVAWQAWPDGGGEGEILAKLVDPFGQPLGPAFQVNTSTQGEQRSPDVAADGEGGFVVSWTSQPVGDDESGTSIRMRTGIASQAAPAPDFQVNTHRQEDQRFSVVAAAPGVTMVVWESQSSAGSDDDGLSVQGRLFGPLLFVDGFESGDTSAWATSAPDG